MVTPVSIEEIFQLPFSERPWKEQMYTILGGKPRPPLQDVFVNNEQFDVSFYDTELWITACARRKRFYCWPCLLFVPEDKSEWTKEGYNNFEHLHQGMKLHAIAVSHITGTLRLQSYIWENLVPEMPPNVEKASKRKRINKNYFRKCLLNLTRELLSQILKPPPTVNDFDCYILEEWMEAVVLLKKFEEKDFWNIFDTLTQPEILINYLATLSRIMKSIIKADMQNSTYVSLIINEHSNEECEVLISLLFRYLKNGKIYERFISFFSISSYKEIDAVILNILKEYGVEEKLIAFSFDGAMSSLSKLQQLFSSSRMKACTALFVPCYFHSLETIFERSISNCNKQCSLFFKTLSSMRDYLNGNPKIQQAFNSFVKEHFNLHDNQSSFKFIVILKKHKKIFSEFFKNVKKNYDEWFEDDVVTANGFRNLLDNPYTVAFIEIFSVLAQVIVDINKHMWTLHNSKPEKLFKNCKKYRTKLNTMRTSDFHQIWNIICDELKESQLNILNNSKLKEEFYDKILDIYNNIMDCVSQELELRFQSLKKYCDYFSLCSLESENAPPECHKRFACFPVNKKLDPVKLQIEIYELRKIYPVLERKPELYIYEFLATNKLQDDFSYLFGALQAIVTTPYKPTFLDDNISQKDKSSSLENLSHKIALSKLESINLWSRIYNAKEKITGNWSFLSIEQDLLNSVNQKMFNDFHRLFEGEYDIFQVL